MSDIAIVGVSCRFPEAENEKIYWENLKNGVNSIQEVTKDRWDTHFCYNKDRSINNKSVSKWCGQLKDIDLFDNHFFNISPKEAKAMDPQQRLLLEEVWHCIENSGISLSTLQNKTTAVYTAYFNIDYGLTKDMDINPVDRFTCIGTNASVLANRISYTFDLKGISMPINVACGSSGLAIYEAYKALSAKECDYAIVSGVNIISNEWHNIAFSKSRMLSEDGQCKTFDINANGYVPGEGVAAIILQRVEDAEDNNLNIYGIVKGVAVNHCGKSKSITAPKLQRQKDMLIHAYQTSNVNPETVSYIETHGTGTNLGDPIEIEALTQAFNKFTNKNQFCQVGSVKTNIGHLEGAAGLAGVIKVLLMMQYKMIPPSININQVNPIIEFENTPFTIATKLMPWKSPQKNIPLRAGVSSLGYSGTNTHVILEAYDNNNVDISSSADLEGKYLFNLSAKSEESLKASINKWIAFFNREEKLKLSLHDIEKTLLFGREDYDYRVGTVIENINDAKNYLLENPRIYRTLKKEKIFLSIGNTVWSSYQEVLDLLGNSFVINNTVEELVENYISHSSKEAFYNNTWNNENKVVFNFIVNYSIYTSLIANGLEIATISGVGNGRLVALAISGICEIQDIIYILLNDYSMENLKLKSPSIQFYDEVTQKTFIPYKFNIPYIEYLLDVKECTLDEESYNYYMNKYIQLQNQFTFRKYIEEWEKPFEALYDKSLHEFILEEAQSYTSYSYDNKKLLSVIIVINSYLKLLTKWEISIKKSINNRLLEIHTLIEEDLLTKESFLKLIQESEPVDSLINKLNSKLAFDSRKISSKFSEKFYNKISVKNSLDWVLEDVESLQANNFDNYTKIYYLGSQQRIVESEKTLYIPHLTQKGYTLKQLLKELWLHGTHIKWNKLYQDLDYNKLQLPNYAFQKKSFWFTKMLDTINDNKTISNNNVYINDHVINNITIVPGAFYIHHIYEKVQKQGNSHLVLKEVTMKKAQQLGEHSIIDLDTHFEENRFSLKTIDGELCTGKIHHAHESLRGKSFEIGKLKNTMIKENIDVYSMLKELGYGYGDSLKVIENIYQNNEESIFYLKQHTQDNSIVNTALLDGILQCGIVLAKQQGLCNPSKMFIPFIIQHIEFNNKLQDQCYVKINKQQIILKQDNLSTALEVYDKEGEILGSIDLIYKNVDKDFIYKQSNKALLYAPSWIEDKGEKRTEESNSRSLIIFGNNNDEIDNWIRTFKDKYDAYYFIQKGLTYEVLSDYKYQVRLNEEQDFIKVFQLISTQQSYRSIDILYNWSYDKSEIIDSYIVEDNIQGFFHMIKACIANKVMNNTHILVITTNTQKIYPTDIVDGYQYSGLVGLSKSIRQEHTRLKIKLVDMPLKSLDYSNRDLIKDEFSNSFSHTSIGYRQGKRYIESIKPILIDEEANINYLRENGVYVVVGGTKGIGNKIARMFVRQKNVKVIAIGRSYSITHQDNNLEGIDYFACNIANSKQVKITMKLIKEKYGAIHGIINCAGIIDDKLFSKKTWDSFTKVLAPKVKGTLNLHKYSLDQSLDFFVVTSSVVSIIGNMGQGDYATGNSFLDSFINYRQSQGFSGLSLSLNYTLWSDGGMGNTKEHIERFQEKAGVINSQSGLQAMNQCIIGQVPRAIVAGNREIEKYFSNNQPELYKEEIKDIPKATPLQIKENIIVSLGKILGLSQEDIDDEADLRELGMESISLIEFGEDLSRLFNLDIDATLLFEYTSVTQIVDYIISKSDITKIDNSSQITIKETKQEQETSDHKIREASTEDIQVEQQIKKNINNGDIAVIGMSGQFPMSEDIREFWKHLVNQDDLIKQVPKDRWDYEAFFGNPMGEENKSNSNWGGFLDDIRGFDASFFGISPREAELMDPQQRLLLQEVWHTLEDSGYTPSQIQGSKTGVYVGVCNNDYDELVIKHGKRFDAYSSTGLYFSIIANRISYLLDLHGPSVSMDTACSSSLVALHQAILAINNGDCDQAFVGGVNIMATPRRYISFSNGGMLSTQGRCKTFDESADGYVRSEGVGVILVKPLEKAIEDNDNIYGVIKSAMVNHGGFSNSLTAPNPNAQGELLKEAYLRAAIHPDTITYMEAHGTGTSLGDPIEINGIKKAFQDLYKYYHMDMPIDNRCAIGAVKTNVGHMESASGIAGIIKVLLSIKHKTICGNIHMNTQNSKIKLEDTPFYFPRQTQEWETVRNSENKIVPRRAGISSFGFGGVNAHVVLEEWQGKEKQHRDYEKNDKHLIILSAKNKERLKIYANNIANYLKDSKNKEDKLYSKVLYDEIVSIVASILSIEHSEVIDAISLSELGFDPINFGIFFDKINEKYNMNITALSNNQMNIDELVNIIDKHISSKSNSEYKYMWNYDLSVEKIAYTLQMGREAFEERIAFEVSNIDEIISKCEAYGLGYHKEGIYEGFVKKRGRGYIPQKDKINIEGLSNKEIGKLWLQGKIIPWSDLYINIPKKCHLPGYPFANDSYWIVEQEESNIQQNDTTQEVYYYKYNWYEENIELVSKDKYRHINQMAIIYDEDSTYNQLVNKIRKNNNNITITPIKIDWEKQDIVDKDVLDTLWKKNNKVSNCHILVNIRRYDEELSHMVMEKGTNMFRNIFNSIENATYKGKWSMTACVRDNIPFAISLDSLCKSVHNFWQSFPFKVVTFTGNVSQEFFIENVYEEIKYQEDNKFIMYKDHKRLVKGIQRLDIDKNIVNYQEGMTYIITGGMGAIGKTVALHLASKWKGKLILVGRSPLNKNKEQVLRKITSLGSEAIYIQGDIAIEEDVKRIIYEGKKRFGSIHCVINTAGVIDSTELIGKSNSSIKNTLLPKVQGTLLLDKYTREEPIERFIMFSSISSVLGDFGQGDYAMANGFLDGYAFVREQLVQENKARGYTQVINWPLWKDGGMHFDKSTEALYLQSSGMDYLTNQSGMKAFDNILKTNEKQAICFVGNKNKINQFLCPNKEKKTKNNNGECTMIEVQEKSKKEIIIDKEKIVNDLVNIASHILKLDKERIDVNENFGNYGFDSIMLKHFANNISEQYNIQLLPTIFFMHTTIEALSEYLYTEQKEAMNDFYIQEEHKEECKEESSSNSYEEDIEGIAIIGIASKFPKANNPHTFYNNLVDDIDCIKEIPRDRWNYEDYYGDINSSKQITNSKWCGFIDDVDKFDAPFFKILPSEAVLIDPQQRLLLQSVWEVIEDAGYTMSSLSDKSVGVFIGAQFADYQEIVTEHGSLSGHATLGNALAMLANRISYQFNFTGPSETIETACSSSLVALNRGIQSLKLGESKVAVVGGVNLALTPTSFIKAAQLGVMSPSGRCRTFDESADGYVKGEGVATVLLKPLSQAIKDKDNIYGIIKGAGVNHGGTANSITSPNSDAQAKLIYKVYQEANISPATISFVETHGTGTELGDPVEIEGLQKAFTKLYNYFGEDVNKSQYCGLGAVKTNIGHLEPAAGIAGLIKVLMSMKYKKLPKNQNFNKQNPYIKLDNTPFYLANETKEWQHMLDEDGKIIPRRAGVSSFGFGGVNAHVILEEYAEHNILEDNSQPYLFILSAKNDEVLINYAKSFINYIEDDKMPKALSSHIAYTLQVGREAMKVRLAIVAQDIYDWSKKLQQYINGNTSIDGLFLGTVKSTNSIIDEEVSRLIHERGLIELGSMWASGQDIPWKKLYQANQLQKVSLPTYPFERKRYWLDNIKDNKEQSKKIERKESNKCDEPTLVNSWIEKAKDYNGDEVQLDIIEDSIAIIRMQDRKNKNMFSENLVKAILKTFENVKANENIKAIIVTGYENIFCMGATQGSLENISSMKEKCSDASFVYNTIAKCPVPVISAMQGYAFGGGLIFGLFADIIVGTLEGGYSANFTQYGFTPGVGSTYILKEKLGTSLANEMMYTADVFTGEELQKRGANIRFAKGDKVLQEAINIARVMVKKPITTIKVLKQELGSRVLDVLPQYIESEVRMHEETFNNIDVNHLIKKFFRNENTQQDIKEHRDLKVNNVEHKKSRAITLTNTKKKIEDTELRSKITLKSTINSLSNQHINEQENIKQNIKENIKDNITTLHNKETSNNLYSDIVNDIKQSVCKLVQISDNTIDEKDIFKELGVDSISGIELIRALNHKYNTSLSTIALYSYPTISELASHLVNELNNSSSNEETKKVELAKEGIRLQSFAGARIDLVHNNQNSVINQKQKVSEKSEHTIRYIEKHIATIVGKIVDKKPKEINKSLAFRDMGIDSISGIEIIRDINRELGISMDTITLYNYSTITKLVEHIVNNYPQINIRETDNNTKLINTQNNIIHNDEDSSLDELLFKLYNQEVSIDDVAEVWGDEL